MIRRDFLKAMGTAGTVLIAGPAIPRIDTPGSYVTWACSLTDTQLLYQPFAFSEQLLCRAHDEFFARIREAEREWHQPDPETMQWFFHPLGSAGTVDPLNQKAALAFRITTRRRRHPFWSTDLAPIEASWLQYRTQAQWHFGFRESCGMGVWA